jgi:hypothetical protein
MAGFDSINAIHLHRSPKHPSAHVRFDNDLINEAKQLGFHT